MFNRQYIFFFFLFLIEQNSQLTANIVPTSAVLWISENGTSAYSVIPHCPVMFKIEKKLTHNNLINTPVT